MAAILRVLGIQKRFGCAAACITNHNHCFGLLNSNDSIRFLNVCVGLTCIAIDMS